MALGIFRSIGLQDGTGEYVVALVAHTIGANDILIVTPPSGGRLRVVQWKLTPGLAGLYYVHFGGLASSRIFGAFRAVIAGASFAHGPDACDVIGAVDEPIRISGPGTSTMDGVIVARVLGSAAAPTV